MTNDAEAMEEWRPAVGHEGAYEVSSLGRVRSVDRSITQKSRAGHPFQRRIRGRVLKLWRRKCGHLYVGLGRGCRMQVHHAVLKSFVGPQPAGMECAHGDGNPANNALSNLRWATHRENEADKRRHGTAMVGAKHPMRQKTHCPAGHPYADGNVYRTPGGWRTCRICHRTEARERMRARRQDPAFRMLDNERRSRDYYANQKRKNEA